MAKAGGKSTGQLFARNSRGQWVCWDGGRWTLAQGPPEFGGGEPEQKTEPPAGVHKPPERMTSKQRILKAILKRLFPPHGLARPDVPTQEIENKVADKWDAECREQGERRKTKPPGWHTINKSQGRE